MICPEVDTVDLELSIDVIIMIMTHKDPSMAWLTFDWNADASSCVKAL
jgi:hypothetical protein